MKECRIVYLVTCDIECYGHVRYRQLDICLERSKGRRLQMMITRTLRLVAQMRTTSSAPGLPQFYNKNVHDGWIQDTVHIFQFRSRRCTHAYQEPHTHFSARKRSVTHTVHNAGAVQANSFNPSSPPGTGNSNSNNNNNNDLAMMSTGLVRRRSQQRPVKTDLVCPKPVSPTSKCCWGGPRGLVVWIDISKSSVQVLNVIREEFRGLKEVRAGAVGVENLQKVI
mmetsp:Transcript_12318/g.14727  ORF Transcript_12318/g.14727 Transcript_12318/m.14727 type:complete len:224 (+) Transcript_12318:110-781(+)